MNGFLSGMITMGFLIAAMFFLRFWRRIADSLFAYFALAFLLLAVNQALIGLSMVSQEQQAWFFVPRLVAFSLLIVGIVAKNMGEGRRPRS